MNTCETCKHWNNKSQLEDLARSDKLRAKGFWLYQGVSRDGDVWDAEFGNCAMLHETDLVKNQDHVDQWWDTPLQTHRSFGCTLWEER